MSRVEIIGDATLYLGDCREIALGAADLVATDPPYGMTDCAWDVALDPAGLWRALRNGREGATFVITASQPFTSMLVTSNREQFRVEWIWEKNAGSNFGTVKWLPMKEHESVLVFAKSTPPYFPIMEERAASGKARVQTVVNYDTKPEAYSGVRGEQSSLRPDLRYPRSIQKFNRERGLHPTQKPVALMEYFVRTYSAEGARVVDPFMGSASTAIACLRAKRAFAGAEENPKHFDTACRRVEEFVNQNRGALI